MFAGHGERVHQRVSVAARRRDGRGGPGRVGPVLAAAEKPDGPVGVLRQPVRRGGGAGEVRRGRGLHAAVPRVRGRARERVERLRGLSQVPVGERLRPERARGRHDGAALRHVHRLRGRGARARRPRLPARAHRAAQRRPVPGRRVRASAAVRPARRGPERARRRRLRGRARVRGPGLRGLHGGAAGLGPHAGERAGLSRVHGAASGVRVGAGGVRAAAGGAQGQRARQERQAAGAAAHGGQGAERGVHRAADEGGRGRQRPRRGRPDPAALGHIRQDVERVPRGGHAARLPGSGQRAGPLRVHASARGRAQRGVRVRRVAVGQGRQRGRTDVRRHIGTEHDRAQGAVVRGGRGQAAGRRRHVQLGGRVQARPGDTDPVQASVELQHLRRDRLAEMFPGGRTVRAVAAPAVPSFFVPEMAKDTEILFDAAGEFRVFYSTLHALRDGRTESQVL